MDFMNDVPLSESLTDSKFILLLSLRSTGRSPGVLTDADNIGSEQRKRDGEIFYFSVRPLVENRTGLW
jgi:hypothetical protein